MRRHILWIMLLTVSMCAGGCNWFEYPLYVLFGDSKINIDAEYDGLAGKKIAVLVMTTPAVDFEHPYARLELTSIVSLALSERVKNATFVDVEEIDRFQREDLDWLSMGIDEIGKKFEVDRVVYLDVIQYTMIEENSVNLLRGRILAEVSVYEMEAAEANAAVYTGEVMVVHPDYAPVPVGGGARQQIELASIRLFAQELARKFTDHKIERDEASRMRDEITR